MRVWSLFRKIIPVLVIAAMLSSFISVVPVAAADPPLVSGAVTNSAGNVITIAFSKAMNDPAGKQAEFSYAVNSGSALTFSAAALESDTTKIDLTTSTTGTIAHGNTVTVSYSGSDVTGTDTGALTSFSNQSVTNNVPATAPIVSGAATSAAGDIIVITFSKTMSDPSGKQAEFTYAINGGSSQVFSAAALHSGDATKLDLTTAGTVIAFNDSITVSYTGTDITSADIGVLASFNNQAVVNNMPVAAPTVTSILPVSGPTAGGTNVTITGTGFVNGSTTVLIGGTAATGITINNSRTIHATTPGGSAAAADVAVNNTHGTGTLTGGFTYLAAPTVTNIAPISGPMAGGTSVTITGTNFAAGATVSIGGVSATNIVVVNATSITATTGISASAGLKNVVVVTPGGSGTLTNGFTYLSAPPTITGVSPIFGSVAGGTHITISGTNFTTGATVTIGGVPAISVAVVNNTTITAITPAGSAGPRDIVVTTLLGGPGTLSNGFTYYAVTVTDVNPASGPLVGGNTVTITGTGFYGGGSSGAVTSVTFGGNSGTNISVTSDTSLTVKPPAGTGTVNIIVITSVATSPVLNNAYTYVPVPTITNISPASGPLSGGTTVTITGTNFVTGATVTIGGVAVTGINVASATSITATTAAGTTGGAKDVVVTTPGGLATLPGGFNYLPVTITSVTPPTGLTSGGTPITITGTGFITGATVNIGGNSATSIVVVSATSITAVTPTGSVGVQNVVVTTSAGSATLTGGFTYTGVQVNAISPTYGPVAGNITVTITGVGFVTGSTVKIGGVSATNVAIVNSTTITATAPAGTAGAKDVTVTTPTETATLTGGFTYAAVTVTAVNPTNGPLTGGTSLTITGTGFVSGASVSIGGHPATGVVVNSLTSITAITPAGTAGTADVVVTASSITSPALVGGFTYLAIPTVTAITPNSGPISGGTVVSITGTNFVTGATVTIGTAAATNVTVNSATSITATTGVSTAGAMNVVITTAGGASAPLVGGFTYAVVTVSRITPNFGPISGGTTVTITGTGFTTGATVSIGGIAATGVTVVNSTTINATTGVSTLVGPANVTVTVTGGTSPVLTGGFTYSAVWWGGDTAGAYGRRTLLTISNATGSILAPYEVKIIVPHVSTMNANFSDVRFVQNDNTTTIPYWINNITSTTSSAEFWVKVTSIPAYDPLIPGSGDLAIYMYYGNTAALSKSDIHATFIFGDDFENPTITTAVTGMTATAVNLDPYVQANNVGSNGAGNPSQQIIPDGTNHVLNLHGDNSPVGGVVTTEKNEPIVEAGQNGTLTPFTATSSFVVDINVKTVGPIPTPATFTNPLPPPANVTGAESAYICSRYTDVMDKNEQIVDFSNNNLVTNTVVGDTWSNLGSTGLGLITQASTWYTLTGVTVRDATGNRDDLQVYVNGSAVMSTNNNQLMTNTGLAFLAYNDNGLFNENFDNFRVRHYAWSEPTTQIGSEQSLITVTSNPAGSIVNNGATLNGGWTALGTTPSLSYSFSYGPTTAYGTTATAQVSGNTFNAAVSSLVSGTPYHFRATVNAGVCGLFYGTDATFTTSGGTTTTTTTTTPPPSGGGGGGGGGGWGPSAPTTVAGVTALTGAINAQGVFTLDVVAWSDDRAVAFVIGTTTKGVDATGAPLTQISILGTTNAPALPAGARIVGLAYNFEQSGAVFTPTVPVRFSYNPALLPAGLAESSLQIAYFDTVLNVWVPLPTTIDINNHFIIAQVAHFTTYAVTYGVPAVTPVVTTTTTPPVVTTTAPVVTTTPPVTTTTPPVETTATPVTTITTKPVPTTTQPTVPPAASFTVSGLVITPNAITTTETATVKVTVTNKGNLAGTSTAVLKLDNIIVGTKSLLLAAGESQDAVFTVSKDTAGTYSIDVNGQSGTLTVNVPAASIPYLFKNWWILALIIIVVAIGTIVLITSRRKSSAK